MRNNSSQQTGTTLGRKRRVLALALAAALLLGVCGCQQTTDDNSGGSATQQGTADSSNAAGGATDQTNKTTPDTSNGQSANATDPSQAGSPDKSDSANEPANPAANGSSPTDGATEGNAVVVYVPSEQADLLTPVGATVADDSDQALVNALIQAGALPEGVEVLSASEKDGTLILDMNQAFADAVRSSGSAGEAMLIYALVNTFVQARDVDNVSLTIEGGGLLESGHEVYDYPLKMNYLE